MNDLVAKFHAVLGTREKGATAVEYGLMVALIAVVIIAAVTLLGDNLASMFDAVSGEVEDATPGG
jgi:pilus assembly protein Flp/PilA